VGGGYNAALVGLNNRLKLGEAWRINTLFERRQGVDGASVADPIRALPFLREEEDYTSFSLGVEFLPAEAPYRLSSRGEAREGESYSSRLFTLSGDAVLGKSLALFSRQQYGHREMARGTSEDIRGDLGLAFRPVSTNALNLLGKATWIRSDNPLNVGVLTQLGRETRLALVGEAIWTPARGVEVASRYALRKTSADRVADDGTLDQVGSTAHYLGSRVRYRLGSRLSLQGESRMLRESLSGATRWDVGPAVGLMLVEGLELLGGYRFGDLRDPDYAVSGGTGAFVQLQAGITEGAVGSIAEFWRGRFR
jgi:hypothetical protein